MNNSTKLPEIGFLRLNQVLQYIPVSKTAWYEGILAGIYPKQVKIGKRSSAWKISDIRKLIAEIGGKA